MSLLSAGLRRLLEIDARFSLLLVCFFLSGLAGLLYETAWTQQFSLVFGTSALAIATVLAAYMAGLAAGAAAARRWVDRIRRPVLCYALLELGIGLGALLVGPGLKLAAWLQSRLLVSHSLEATASWSSALFYLVVSFLVLMVPTAAMGATLPLLVRHAIHEEGQISRRVSVLYAVNTVGAATGTLLAAFVLLPRLGLGATIRLGVAVNVLVFLAATALARLAPAPPRLSQPAAARRRWHWMLLFMLLSGFVSFSLEVLWSRLLAHVLGGSLYAFATMLATFLAGIAIGSAIAGRLASSRAAAQTGFAVVQLSIAVLSSSALAFVDRVPLLAEKLVGNAPGLLLPGVVLSSLTLFPAALGIGATFPFAVRSMTQSPEEAGLVTARVYAWNTVGAILGSLATGFVLLPALRFAGTATAAAAISLALATATSFVPPRRVRLGAVALGGLLVLAFWHPPTPWRVLRTSAIRGESLAGEVLFYRVGRSATVLLVDQGVWWRLTTNGLPESSIQPPGSRRAGVTSWLAMLPLAMRPSARSVLAIGLGGGQNIIDLPATVESIDVVELEPEVIAANRFASSWRDRDPLADPRVELHVDDARSALQRSDARYDVIVSQPSHPWTEGAANLYTREFFELVRERLTHDGVFVAWMGLAFVDTALVQTLIATLLDVFPHVEVYEPNLGAALLFVAGTEPMTESGRVQASLESAPQQWRELGVLSVEDVLLLRTLDDTGARRFAATASVNTDDLNLLRARSPLLLGEPAVRRSVRADLIAAYATKSSDLDRDLFYMVQRLIALNAFGPALRVAHSLRNPAEREPALALVELAQGRRQQAEERLWRVARQDPSALEPLYGLYATYRPQIRRGRAPDGLYRLLGRDAGALAVAEAEQQLGAGSWRAVRELDSTLAALDPHHPFFSAALLQRLEWRLLSGDPSEARVALALAELNAARNLSSEALLLRARAGQMGGNDGVTLASLRELVPMLRPRRREMVNEALEIADSLSPELEERGRRQVREMLAAKLVSAGDPATPE